VSGRRLIVPGGDVAEDNPAHVYAVAPRNDGLWGVWCYACSAKVSNYVYPCERPEPGKVRMAPRPPAVLAAPSKLAQMQKDTEALRAQVHAANGALSQIAQALGLWEGESDTLDTGDILAAIKAMTAVQRDLPIQGFQT
jgi:hypothetical protein